MLSCQLHTHEKPSNALKIFGETSCILKSSQIFLDSNVSSLTRKGNNEKIDTKLPEHGRGFQAPFLYRGLARRQLGHFQASLEKLDFLRFLSEIISYSSREQYLSQAQKNNLCRMEKYSYFADQKSEQLRLSTRIFSQDTLTKTKRVWKAMSRVFTWLVVCALSQRFETST